MIKKLAFVLPIFILIQACASSSIPTALLQQLKKADKNAAVITRLSGDVVDISNATISAKESVSWELVPFSENFSDTELKNIFLAYSEAAEGYCEKLKKVSDEGEIIGTNTKRFRCLSPNQYAVMVANRAQNYCQGWYKLMTKNNRNLKIEEVLHPSDPVSICRTTGKPENYCVEVDKIFQGIKGANCGFIIKSIEAFMSTQSNPIEAVTQPNNLADTAKKRCVDLGIAPSTERFGECVLRMLK
jgi:hypothetical protein